MSLSVANYLLYIGYMLASIAMAGVFLLAYLSLTPVKELRLIREGNLACALSFGGALVGFCIAQASAMTHSIGLADFALWGCLAALVQIGAYFLAAKIIPHVSGELARGNTAAGAFCCALSLAIGILNAACLID